MTTMQQRPFDFIPRTSTIFGEESFERLGSIARSLGFQRVLIVSDPGIAKCGFDARAVKMLWDVGLTVFTFHEFGANPDTAMAPSTWQSSQAASTLPGAPPVLLCSAVVAMPFSFNPQ